MSVNMKWYNSSMRVHTVQELEKVLDAFFALEPSLVEVHAFLLGLQAQHGELPPKLVGTTYQVRLRELFQGLEVAHDEAYLRTLVTASEGHRLHLLRRDEQMRELIWQVLAWNGGTEDSLASLDRSAYGPRAHWASDIATLVAEGLLDRARVLRACLAGLVRDLSAYQANWFSGLYTDLKPTPEEAAADQDLLLRALDSGINATVSMATMQLAAVQRAGKLASTEFLDHCHGPLTGAKSIASTGLRIIQRLDAPAERKAEAVAVALSHPHAAVQIAAAEALRELGAEEVLREGAQLLSPAVAAQFGIDVAETAAQQIDETSARRVVPWGDDALERAAALIEGGDALEVELAMAWVAVTDDAATVLAPLTKRAKACAKRGSIPAEFLHAVLDPEAPSIPPSALDPFHKPRPDQSDGEVGSALRVWAIRMREVVEMVRGERPRRLLLATLSDEDGWITWDDFAHRAAEPTTAPPADLFQAIWRLHPEDRQRGAALLGTAVPAQGTYDEEFWQDLYTLHPQHLQAVALAFPDDTAPLVPTAKMAIHKGLDEVAPRQLDALSLELLTRHPGRWDEAAGACVALGLASRHQAVRASAAELVASKVPGRLRAEQLATAMADQVSNVVLSRWAGSLADAAGLNPDAVIDVLTALLPKLEHGATGVAKLLTLLHDEQTRKGRSTMDAALRGWLEQFSGSSAAAKAARQLLVG
ncbi:MAG: DUF6493 family protein [Propionibacteriaceae bacterium]|nr:DUF6493 family protein [Propionibacteriaceae bacterium]